MRDDRRDKRFCLILACFCAAGFLLLLALVSADSAAGFDDPVRAFFYRLRSDALTPSLIVLTNTANKYCIISLCLILLILPWTRLPFGLPLSAGALVTILINHFLKGLVERPRPDALHLVTEGGFSFPSGHSVGSLFFYGMAIWLVWHYVSREADPAGPADPGGGSVSVAAGPADPEQTDAGAASDSRASFFRILSPRPLPPYHKRTAILLTILLLIPMLLVGPTRVYLGVHFPTDVLAGWCLSGFAVSLEAGIILALEGRHRTDQNSTAPGSRSK